MSSPTSDIEMEEEALIDLDARLRSLGLERVDIDRDGNCQFRALADQILGDQELHSKIRQVVVDELRRDPGRYRDLAELDYQNVNTYEKYCDKMASDTTWGDSLTMQVAANYYRVSITIYRDVSEEPFRVGPADGIVQRSLVMVHYAEVHYDSTNTIGNMARKCSTTNTGDPSSSKKARTEGTTSCRMEVEPPTDTEDDSGGSASDSESGSKSSTYAPSDDEDCEDKYSGEESELDDEDREAMIDPSAQNQRKRPAVEGVKTSTMKGLLYGNVAAEHLDKDALNVNSVYDVASGVGDTAPNVQELIPKNCIYDQYILELLHTLDKPELKDCLRQICEPIAEKRIGTITQSQAEAIMTAFYHESTKIVGEKTTDDLIELAKYNHWASIIKYIHEHTTAPTPSIRDLLAGKSPAAAKEVTDKYLYYYNTFRNQDAPGDDIVDDSGSYSPYKHSLRLFPEKARMHPDKLKETTSLASISLPPLPAELLDASYTQMVEDGLISIAQLEAVLYAKRQFEGPRLSEKGNPRAGFFLGDGAGVGKGRTIAALIKDFVDNVNGKRVVWVSASRDLIEDARRDLKDVGCSIKTFREPATDKEISYTKGVLFVTYHLLRRNAPQDGVGDPKDKNRLEQMIRWLQDCPQGSFIIFDECHKGKNLIPPRGKKPTDTGLAMKAMQVRLPNARVLYASATGVSNPRHLAYMIRLSGLGNRDQTIQSLQASSLTTVEIASMSLKATGNYISRILSYEGAKFYLVDIEMAEDIKKQYDNATKFWVGFYEVMENLKEFIRNHRNEDEELLLEKREIEERLKKRSDWGKKMGMTFWEAHQRCFKIILVASKISKAVEIADEEIKNGHCVVIGIYSTGEASTNQAANDIQQEGQKKITDYVSLPQQIIKKCIKSLLELPSWIKSDDPALKPVVEKMILGCEAINSSLDPIGIPNVATLSAAFSQSASLSHRKLKRPLSHKSKESEQRIPKKQAQLEEAEKEEDADPQSSGSRPIQGPQEDTVKSLSSCEKKLHAIINDMELPPNPLDRLKRELVNMGHKVAELTGRKSEVYMEKTGEVMLKSRDNSKNPQEREEFMNGEKLVAIISEACSTGISLQADKRRKNIRRRVHLTLELPWSADKAIQQLGRTHRANQTQPPTYKLLLHNQHEVRFASAVAKQLKEMGAILHGDSNTLGAAQQLSQFQLQGKDADRATELVIKTIFKVDDSENFLCGYNVKVPDESVLARLKIKLKEVGIDHKCQSPPHFYSRVLGIDISSQEELYSFFFDALEAVVRKMRADGTFIAGIVTISGQNVQEKEREVIKAHATGGNISGVRIELDRGVSWDSALKLKQELYNNRDGSLGQQKSGLYKHKSLTRLLNGSRVPLVTLATELTYNNGRPNRFKMTRPYGSETQVEQRDFEGRYQKIEETDAKRLWEQWYTYTHDRCMHGDNCTIPDCTIGKRITVKYLICGAVLPFWGQLQKHHHKKESSTEKYKKGKVIPLKVIKLQVDDVEGKGKPVVGVEAVCKERYDEFKRIIRAAEEPFPDQQQAEGRGEGKMRGRPRKPPIQLSNNNRD